MAQRFIWPSMGETAGTGLVYAYHARKISRYVSAPMGVFDVPSRRFKHVHLNIVVMPIFERRRYCLMCMDCFTRWPAFPIESQEAETVARISYEGWICDSERQCESSRTNREQQFESGLFRRLSESFEIRYLRTMAYHPQANGMVERFHHQLKAAIKCQSLN